MASTQPTNCVFASVHGGFGGVRHLAVTPAESAPQPRRSDATAFWMDGKGGRFAGRESAGESFSSRGDT